MKLWCKNMIFHAGKLKPKNAKSQIFFILSLTYANPYVLRKQINYFNQFFIIHDLICRSDLFSPKINTVLWMLRKWSTLK